MEYNVPNGAFRWQMSKSLKVVFFTIFTIYLIVAMIRPVRTCNTQTYTQRDTTMDKPLAIGEILQISLKINCRREYG